MKIKALDKSNCGVARHGGEEAGVKATSPRTETGCEAGDADEFAPQNEVPVSASQVKPGVVWRKSHPLPGEACAASRPSRGRSNGTITGNRGGEPAGVSRGRSSAGYEPGVSVPQVGCAERPGRSHERVKDRTDQDCGDRHDLPALERVRPCAAEKDRGHRGDLRRSPLLLPENRRRRLRKLRRTLKNDAVTRSEPPGTDPYAGWCGGRELTTPGYPIRLFFMSVSTEEKQQHRTVVCHITPL